ncbi:MAG TPA: HlyD family type I secretion periplasmic adaptor subunit [Rhodocyclaceae bacterium]|nr:HlyD family type I secretion periplasmic adaptor subunit [Rhodocyclaceae bacterium]
MERARDPQLSGAATGRRPDRPAPPPGAPRAIREERLDWTDDADWAILQQEPLRARSILWLSFALMVALLVWSAHAEIDEVTRGNGRVIPSSQLQVVQAVDGGVVEEILVREGQRVEPGDVLLRIDPTRFESSLLESRAERLALQAKAARLTALTQGIALELPDEVVREVPQIAAHELRLYESSVEGMQAQIAIAREQLSQRRQELNEARARHNQALGNLELVTQELAVTRPLVRTGAVSEVEVLRLERDATRLRGDRDQAAAQMSRLQAAISEASRRIEEIELNVRNQMRGQLSETLARLNGLVEGSRALADRVKHAELRSPVRGTVVRLRVNTVGAVVQPGREVVEVLPLDDALILEARISPKDIAFLRPGQAARVKFSAYDFQIYGALDATVEHISADSIADERGDTYYLVRVRTTRASLGDDLPILPGMVAQVEILTGKNTILSYILKPVLRAKANALTER